MLRVVCLAAISSVLVLAGHVPSPDRYNVHWNTPQEFGSNEAGQQTYFSTMPIGNGDLVASVWPNVTMGGLQMYIRKADAMSSQTELFTIINLQVLVSGLSPNPFAPGSYYNQTLDLPTATVSVLVGGTSFEDYTLQMSVYVDANTNQLFISAYTRDGGPASVTVNIMSVRPSTEEQYKIPFMCFQGISQPDVFVQPLPPSFAANTLVVYHRNDPALDGSTIQQTLQQQGLDHLVASTPDWWSKLQFGVAVDRVGGGALTRSSPSTLVSAAAASSFIIRVTALTNITSSPEEWLAQLAAVVSKSQQDYPAHLAWWTAFWQRSYINASCTPDSPTPPPKAVQESEIFTNNKQDQPRANPPISGALLWLDASTLALPDKTPLALWRDLSGSGHDAAQATASKQPVYLAAGGLGGLPTVRFDGVGAFLQNTNAQYPATSTIFAVIRDLGSTTVCCSGVLYVTGATTGLGTCRPAGNSPLDGSNDDDAPHGGPRIVLMIDWAGSGNEGKQDIYNDTIVASATFAASNTSSYANGCLESMEDQGHGATGRGFMVGSRNNELARYFDGDVSEILVYPRALSTAERLQVEDYLMKKWTTTKKSCKHANDPCSILNQQQTLTRYVQTIQSRTMWPIKFNGMLFQAATPPNADYRDWGPSNWWQNTRLSYGPMLENGDADIFETILRYYENTLPFATGRTLAYFNHTGVFYTETKHICGAFASEDYGCGTRPAGWPVWLETNDYIKNDYGGDGGTPEVAMQVLDHYLYTQDAEKLKRYLPIATLALDFFRQHYPNRTSDGKIVVWPTQALETYWCAGWDTRNNRPPANCCVDDLPTLAGMWMLVEKLLQLPAEFSTPAQRADWTAFQKMLQPLPITSDGTKFSPARVVSSGVHNSETPELYGVHPYRLLTVGRKLSQGVDLTRAINSFQADSLAYSANSGWNQGIMNAALLGLTPVAAKMLGARAMTHSAPGYRFPGFMPHMQDYEPSSNHLANFMTAFNWMLLQPADDGFQKGTIVVFAAWPCDWSVSFKLWAPLNTTVEIVYQGGTADKGKLISMDVVPAERASAVVFANCV